MKKALLLYTLLGSLVGNSISSADIVAEKNYTETEVTNGGTITGSVKYAGDSAALTLNLEGAWDLNDASKVASEKMIVSKTNNGLKFTVVSIKDITQGEKREIPSIHPIIDQQRNIFIPHLVSVLAGTTIDILNGDEEMHNIHTRSIKNQPFNLGTTHKQRISKTFSHPEIIKLTCDIHKGAYAWIIVMDNPYFDVTDRNGYFEISDIPPGTYTLQVWHEELGNLEKEVTVRKDEITPVEFVYSQH